MDKFLTDAFQDLVPDLWDVLSNPTFWILIGLMVASWQFSVLLINAWNRILAFFHPVLTPGELPTGEGPSPFQRFMGCLGGLLQILLFVFIGIIGLYFWSQP